MDIGRASEKIDAGSPKLGKEQKKRKKQKVFAQIWSSFSPKLGEEQRNNKKKVFTQKVFTQIWSQFFPKIR